MRIMIKRSTAPTARRYRLRVPPVRIIILAITPRAPAESPTRSATSPASGPRAASIAQPSGTGTSPTLTSRDSSWAGWLRRGMSPRVQIWNCRAPRSTTCLTPLFLPMMAVPRVSGEKRIWAAAATTSMTPALIISARRLSINWRRPSVHRLRLCRSSPTARSTSPLA